MVLSFAMFGIHRWGNTGLSVVVYVELLLSLHLIFYSCCPSHGSEVSIRGMLIMSTLCCSAVKLSWHQYSIPCYDGKPDRSLPLPLQQISAFIPAKVKERASEEGGEGKEQKSEKYLRNTVFICKDSWTFSPDSSSRSTANLTSSLKQSIFSMCVFECALLIA